MTDFAQPNQRPRLSRVAITSVLLAVISLLLLPMPFVMMKILPPPIWYPPVIRFSPVVLSVASAVIGMILGIVAWFQVELSDGLLRGKALAIVGAILSLLPLLLLAAGFVLLMYMLRDFPSPD
jgi:hypothetical protein